MVAMVEISTGRAGFTYAQERRRKGEAARGKAA
jgi:hypothetical protein